MPPSYRLLIFLRYPQLGRTKTRLIPVLGPAGAAQLQRQMAEYLLAKLEHPAWQIQIYFTGAHSHDMQSWLGKDRFYRPQVEGDLGKRLWSGFQSAFAEDQSVASLNRAIAVGADCPDLSVRHIHQAFEYLEHHDLVLGPAQDGGYYLIGLRQSSYSQRSLFTDISWSTSAVLLQTVAKAQELSLPMVQLETLADIDRPEDLAIWHRLQAAV